MERDPKLIKLRPEVAAAKITKGISDIEKFQNITLRPIIKLQNDLLIQYYSHYARSYQKDWGSISNEKKKLFIENSMNSNQKMKRTFLGLIIGMFTIEEFNLYLQHKSEFNRRIIQIIKQRILSHLPEL